MAVTGPTAPAEWGEISRAALAHLAPRAPQAAAAPIADLSQVLHCEKIVQKEQAVIHLAFPTVPVTHPDQVALAILDEALSDLGSRLFIRIREELGLAYFVGTSQFLGLEAGHFFFYLGTDPAKRREIETELLSEVAELADSGLTQQEFLRAKAKMESQDKLEQQNPSQIAYAAAISLDEVNAIARRYFSNPHYVLAVVSPQ